MKRRQKHYFEKICYKIIDILYYCLQVLKLEEVIFMKKLNVLDWVALVLVIVGAVNWGLLGLFGFDLVAAIFGSMSLLSRIVYGLVGLSGVYFIFIVNMLGKKSD